MLNYNTVEQIYNRNHGSERLYRRAYCESLNYTEGIMDFQKSLNAFWVIDNVVSYIPTILKAYNDNQFEFYVVEIYLNKFHQGYMEIYTEDYVQGVYNEHISILKQEIPYIDLPQKDNEITTYKFFLSLSDIEPIKFTFYLPSEY